MKGTIFYIIGIIGIIVSNIIGLNEYTSDCAVQCIILMLLGTLLSIIIIALGRIISLLSHNQKNGGKGNESKN